MNKILIILLTFSSFNLFAASSQTIRYSEAVDVFEITDNVSLWHANSERAYYDSWVKKFGIEGKDHSMFERYKKLRSRYQQKPPQFQEEILFSKTSIPLDFFSHSFYSSRSVGEALGKLRKKLKPDEVKFLVEFYGHFKDKISVMVKESTFFINKSKEFDKAFKKEKGKSLSKKVAKFFNKKGKRSNVNIFFVWWPKEMEPKISSFGQNILVRYHPIEHVNKLTVSDVMEGVVLSFMSSMTPNEKVNMSKQFSSICAIKGPLKNTDIFEKPLAVAIGRILLASETQKKNFNLYKDWTLHPWGNTYSKILYPLVIQKVKKGRAPIGAGDFIPKAASACHELSVLKDFFSTFKDLST